MLHCHIDKRVYINTEKHHINIKTTINYTTAPICGLCQRTVKLHKIHSLIAYVAKCGKNIFLPKAILKTSFKANNKTKWFCFRSTFFANISNFLLVVVIHSNFVYTSSHVKALQVCSLKDLKNYRTACGSLCKMYVQLAWQRLIRQWQWN